MAAPFRVPFTAVKGDDADDRPLAKRTRYSHPQESLTSDQGILLLAAQASPSSGAHAADFDDAPSPSGVGLHNPADVLHAAEEAGLDDCDVEDLLADEARREWKRDEEEANRPPSPPDGADADSIGSGEAFETAATFRRVADQCDPFNSMFSRCIS
jgi:hypothetical protein